VSKLSILLPTYNGERFLDEQLETILAQTDGDFELLALDDGSTDGTPALLARYAAQEPRMRVVPSSGNRGQNVRLLELLAEARAEYVAIADQDDRWALDRNERLFAALDGHQAVFGKSELIDADGSLLGRSILQHFRLSFCNDDHLSSLIQPLFSAHAMIVRREAMAPEAFFNTLPFDWLIALDAVFGSGIVYCDEAIVYHRIHGLNQCNNLDIVADGKRMTRSDLNYILLFRTPARLRLQGVFDYLGRSQRLSPALRKSFDFLANRCYTVWFSESRALKSADAGLYDQIMTALTPLAGSEADRMRFARYVGMLTGPVLSAAMFSEVKRRYQLLQAG
jgi:glycosyltransferase involved in cell wall biosynthesis